MIQKAVLVECPRDAMQGVKTWIPTAKKITYINALLKCPFDVIDVGSFVSPRAIPQMSDTKEVINEVEWAGEKPEFLVIVANEKGAEEAAKEDRVDVLGFPFSLSETFQQRNTNASMEEALIRLDHIAQIAKDAKKQLVIYLSMAFGNPYGDAYDMQHVEHWLTELNDRYQPQCLALSDTIGIAEEEQLKQLFGHLTQQTPHIPISAHLHSPSHRALSRIEAAWAGGCRRFDGAIGGHGGCPMATDQLTGNLPMELLLPYIATQDQRTWDPEALQHAIETATNLFNTYHP